MDYVKLNGRILYASNEHLKLLKYSDVFIQSSATTGMKALELAFDEVLKE